MSENEMVECDAWGKRKNFKPKKGEQYWVVNNNSTVTDYYWRGDIIDLSFYYVGNCFKTNKSAHEHASEIIEKLRRTYEEDRS